MPNSIAEILNDKALKVPEKVERVTALLSAQPNRGADAALGAILAPDPPLAATYAANYLSLLPDLAAEKRQAVEHLMSEQPPGMIPMTNLVKDMPADVVDKLTALCLANASASGTYSVLFEIALYFPERLRSHMGEIDDESLREATLPGAPDERATQLADDYRTGHDHTNLRLLSRFRTPAAIAELRKLQPVVPSGEQDALRIYLENSGIFPAEDAPSVYPKTYRGFVVDRPDSPHHMGGAYPGPVPACPICQEPAARVLTLDARALDLGLHTEHNPTFFWFECDDHILQGITVHFTPQGIEGLMVPMTDEPAGTKLIPGERALLLQPHPNQHGMGLESIGGFSNHQVGGYPWWIQMEGFPLCPLCRHGMRFLAAIDSGMTPFGRMNFGGTIYGFWCDSCNVSVTQHQAE